MEHEIDFTKMCRLCLNRRGNESDFIELFQQIELITKISKEAHQDKIASPVGLLDTDTTEIDLNQNNEIVTMLRECVHLEIQSTDLLPKNICTDCHQKLLINNIFRTQCKASEKYLRNILQQQQTRLCMDQSEKPYEVNIKMKCAKDVETLPFKSSEVEDCEIVPEIDLNCKDIVEPIEKTITKQIKFKLKKFEKINKSKERQNIRKKRTIKTAKPPTEEYKVCPICGGLKKDMRAHLQKHDKNRKLFSCNDCDKVFKDKTGLDRHMENVHIDKRQFKCPQCTQAFNNNWALQRHRVTHIEPKHQCQYCAKKFRSQSARDSHHNVHTQEQKYVCSHCGKSFVSHSNLRNHVNIHTGERPYKCGFCPLTFVSTSSATVHRRTHFNGKPYKCDICSLDIVDMRHYKTHMQSHRTNQEIVL